MTCSTDTSHGRPCARGQRGARARIMRVRSARVELTPARRTGALAQRRLERRDDAPALAARCRLRSPAPARRRGSRNRSTQNSSCAAARAVEQRRRVPRATSASASVTNGARPTPPATIQRFRRADRQARTGGRAGRARRCATPARASYEQRRADADALVEDRDARAAAVRVAQDLEDGKRTPQQRIEAARRLDHHELAGRGERGDVRRAEREHVVVGRQPPVRDHRRVDVDRHPPKYTLALCASCACSPTRVLAGALGAAYLTILVLQLNPRGAARVAHRPALVRHAGRVRTACTSRWRSMC